MALLTSGETMGSETDAFRTISEVAEELGLPAHVLRFWETRFPEISPMKRAGGRRYYRPQDVQLLRVVRRLLHEEGYTIKGVQRLFKERGVENAASIIDALPESRGTSDRVHSSEDGRPTDEPRSLVGDGAGPGSAEQGAKPQTDDRASGADTRPEGAEADERQSAVLDALELIQECETILARSRRPK